MYGTDLTTEPIRKPTWDSRIKATTVHRPRNTKRDKRRDGALLAALYDSSDSQQVVR